MSELIPQECDVVILKTGERVGLMDQLDETHFLPDYGVETPEQEEKTMAMMPISIDDIEKVVCSAGDVRCSAGGYASLGL